MCGSVETRSKANAWMMSYDPSKHKAQCCFSDWTTVGFSFPVFWQCLLANPWDVYL